MPGNNVNRLKEFIHILQACNGSSAVMIAAETGLHIQNTYRKLEQMLEMDWVEKSDQKNGEDNTAHFYIRKVRIIY